MSALPVNVLENIFIWRGNFRQQQLLIIIYSLNFVKSARHDKQSLKVLHITRTPGVTGGQIIGISPDIQCAVYQGSKFMYFHNWTSQLKKDHQEEINDF